MKIYFLNDTGRVHAGSSAVMRSLLEIFQGHEIIGKHKVGSNNVSESDITACDLVVCNGEGTIHHRADGGRFLLETLELAQRHGKYTALVNTMFQEDIPYYKSVFEKLDLLTVRDPISYQLAKENGGNPKLLLDSCAAARDWSPKLPVRHLKGIRKGKIHWSCRHKTILDEFNYKVKALPRLYILNDYPAFIESIRNLDLYITGEYHAIYAAGLAGIAFVPISSNSHKIEALIKWAGVDIPVCKTAEEIEKSIDLYPQRQDQFSAFYEFLHKMPYLTKSDFKGVLI